jgi:hypothetical protein
MSFVPGCGSWLGRYNEYGRYLAIFHIHSIDMLQSELFTKIQIILSTVKYKMSSHNICTEFLHHLCPVFDDGGE